MDQGLENDIDYQAIRAVIKKMNESGLLEGAAGNCIGISEILQHLLGEIGINSRLIECKLLSTDRQGNAIRDFQFIGYNADHRLRDQGWVDTHVVLITETNIPQLIDLSVPHLLKNGKKWVHDRVNSIDPEIVSEYHYGDQHLMYSVKKNIRLIGMHQTSLVDRIDSEQKIKKQILQQRHWLIALILFGAINFALNISLMILGHVFH